MSGSLLRCLQEAGLWLDLRQHLCNRSCLFWNTYTVSLQIIPDFLWGKFSARRLRIFTHITLLFSFDRADSGLSKFFFCFFLFFFLCYDCKTLLLPRLYGIKLLIEKMQFPTEAQGLSGCHTSGGLFCPPHSSLKCYKNAFEGIGFFKKAWRKRQNKF